MSTFIGIVKEFPQIRIDYFRHVAGEEPPLACFLSHVHSDHLQGLESLKAPFVYCSPATREILLRLEKYPHRMNFAKGILESRKQTYRHLSGLLKTIPLETPTVIELHPGYELRVTLFDANHCVGAAMFLIEGNGKAILYTGDIRSESWWVNSLVRNPVLLPYAECIKKLDCIYLDTTFASKQDRYREFPSKAEGVKELVRKVTTYPQDTIFYFEAWTFGYEHVWIALSALLQTGIHLDRYRWSLYRSLLGTSEDAVDCQEARPLCGFLLGNNTVRSGGCLSTDINTRIHSCEKGTSCSVIRSNTSIVRIAPIVSRLADGTEMHEMGLGGGKGDLDETHELELNDATALGALMQLCAANIEERELLLSLYTLLNTTTRLDLGAEFRSKLEQEDIKLDDLVQYLKQISADKHACEQSADGSIGPAPTESLQPKTITFPYSRHSSYFELCYLLQAFKPRDVYPCTVDEANWTPDVSMQTLFGHLCSAQTFRHDAEMRSMKVDLHGEAASEAQETQENSETQASVMSSHSIRQEPQTSSPPREIVNLTISSQLRSETANEATAERPVPSIEKTKPVNEVIDSSPQVVTKRMRDSSPSSPASTDRVRGKKIRRWAYQAALGLDGDCDSWDTFGGLQCVKKAGDELELG